MTEKQKKIAIIAGTIIIAVLLLMRSKGGSASVVNQNGDVPTWNVSIPGFNIPERGDIVVNIPALPARSAYNYNAISPCMCNGAGQTSNAYRGPLVEVVNNQAGNGPNVYNYLTQQSSQPSNYNPFSYFAASPLG